MRPRPVDPLPASGQDAVRDLQSGPCHRDRQGRLRFVALRGSNLLLLTMLFPVGHRRARAARITLWIFGPILVSAGLAMVVVAISPGG